MKTIISLALVLLLAAGCSWTPTRDNTVDPHSPYYVQGNRAPNVDSVWMITDCYESYVQDLCAFDAYCKVSDPDNNILFDSIICRLIVHAPPETLLLGQMVFNPEVSAFSIRRLQSEMPGGNLEQYVGVTDIVVTVVDDAGARDTARVDFHDLDKQWPTQTHPKGEGGPQYPVLLTDLHPRLGWNYWRSCQQPHTFSLSVVENFLNTAWDTSGLAFDESHCLADTFAVVGRELRESVLSTILYSWYLTVVTPRGDRITSTPGYFYIQTGTSPAAGKTDSLP